MGKEQISAWMDDAKRGFHFHMESSKLSIIAQVCKWMNEHKITKPNLAEKLDVPISHLDSFFSAGKHFDFKFLCKLTHIMGYQLTISPKDT